VHKSFKVNEHLVKVKSWHKLALVHEIAMTNIVCSMQLDDDMYTPERQSLAGPPSEASLSGPNVDHIGWGGPSTGPTPPFL